MVRSDWRGSRNRWDNTRLPHGPLQGQDEVIEGMGLADRAKQETSLSQSIEDSVSREVQESEMKWKDEYVTGIQRIDRQHRSLFRTVDFKTKAVTSAAANPRT